MYSPKAILLERFNIIINKKSEQETTSISGNSDKNEHRKEGPSLFDKNYLNPDKGAESIEKLERRMNGLEQQNDQLLYFINFLLDNLPELVMNIIQHGDKTEDPSAETCCSKNTPCPTRREREVLELLVKGYCAKEIANHLFISETTVITHKKNLKEKFNARNTVELISKAQTHLAKQL